MNQSADESVKNVLGCLVLLVVAGICYACFWLWNVAYPAFPCLVGALVALSLVAAARSEHKENSLLATFSRLLKSICVGLLLLTLVTVVFTLLNNPMDAKSVADGEKFLADIHHDLEDVLELNVFVTAAIFLLLGAADLWRPKASFIKGYLKLQEWVGRLVVILATIVSFTFFGKVQITPIADDYRSQLELSFKNEKDHEAEQKKAEDVALLKKAAFETAQQHLSTLPPKAIAPVRQIISMVSDSINTEIILHPPTVVGEKIDDAAFVTEDLNELSEFKHQDADAESPPDTAKAEVEVDASRLPLPELEREEGEAEAADAAQNKETEKAEAEEGESEAAFKSLFSTILSSGAPTDLITIAVIKAVCDDFVATLSDQAVSYSLKSLAPIKTKLQDAGAHAVAVITGLIQQIVGLKADTAIGRQRRAKMRQELAAASANVLERNKPVPDLPILPPLDEPRPSASSRFPGEPPREPVREPEPPPRPEPVEPVFHPVLAP